MKPFIHNFGIGGAECRELDKNNPNIELLKHKGAVVIFGNGEDQENLEKVKAYQASHLVLVTDQDTTNIEVISTLIKMKTEILQPIKCYVHLEHNEFYDFFMAKDFGNSQDKLDIKLFNIHANSARILFEGKNHALGSNVFTSATKLKDPKVKVKVAILGFGNLGENILIHALQLGHFYNENPIEITVVYDMDKDENANILDEFIKHYSIGIDKTENKNTTLTDYWNINFVDDGDFATHNISDYSQIIIAYDNELESLSNLMKLLKKKNKDFLEHNVDIAVYSNSFNNTAGVIDRDKEGQENAVFKQVRTFGELSTTCNYEIVIDEVLDKKAKLNNKQYNQLHGYDDKSKTTDEEWLKLSLFLKDSNRYLIEHNEIKKFMIELLIADSTTTNDYETIKNTIKQKYFNYPKMSINWDQMGLQQHRYALKLSEEEIVQLAKVEHKRWNAFHILNGWETLEIPSMASEKIKKDPIRKLHPCLVSWDELDAVSHNHQHNYKSDDIETIMRIPSLETLSNQSKG